MVESIEILKRKLENLTPEVLETISKMVNQFEIQNTFSIAQFQKEEVQDRLSFHQKNPNTKLDFFENIRELEKWVA